MKLVHVASNPAEASMIVADLESRGIRSKTNNEELAGIAGEVGLGASTSPQVWVLDDADEERAIEIVKTYLDGVDTSEPGEPWTCEGCKETNEGHFALCWKCQSPKTT